jgi:hypothetical protein
LDHSGFFRLENSQLQTSQTLATSPQRITLSPLRTQNPLKGGFLRLDLLPEVVQKNMEVSKLRTAGVRYDATSKIMDAVRYYAKF